MKENPVPTSSKVNIVQDKQTKKVESAPITLGETSP